MINRPPTRVRLALALIGVCALVATSCGGGSTDAATETSSATEAASPAPTTEAPAAAAAQTEAAPTVESGTSEASLIATTVTGSQIDFGSLEGQDVVLWFWAPW